MDSSYFSKTDLYEFIDLFDLDFEPIFTREFGQIYNKVYYEVKPSPDELPNLEEMLLKIKSDYPVAYQNILKRYRVFKTKFNRMGFVKSNHRLLSMS